jgi:hypothetical protein
MGRPREFDLDATSDLATQRANEYHRGDLTEPLFRLRWQGRPFSSGDRALRRQTTSGGRGSVPKVAEHPLHRYTDVVTDPKHAAGCLATNSALPCRKGDPVGELPTAGRRDLMAKVAVRFKQARKEGNLPASIASSIRANGTCHQLGHGGGGAVRCDTQGSGIR